MSDNLKILEMIESGTITAAEGMDLLKALELTEESEKESLNFEKGEIVNNGNYHCNKEKKVYKTLRIHIYHEEDDINVNVNVPLGLLKVLGSVAGNVYQFIPEEAKETMDDKGINLRDIDIAKLVSAIEEGTLDDTTLVDINMNEGSGGKIEVKIYVE